MLGGADYGCAMSDGWADAVREVSGHLGLTIDVDEEDDEHLDDELQAEGDIGNLYVQLSLEEVGFLKEVAMIQVGTHGDDALWLRRKGSKLPFGGGTPHRFELQDPEFDRTIEVGGCSASIKHVLRYDYEFRRWVQYVVGELGATFKDGTLIWSGPPPESAQQIRAILDPMLELGRRIREPRASHQLPAVGTAAAVWLRRLAAAAEDDLRQHLIQLFQHITPHLGPGQGYVNHNEGVVEWQGRVQDLPTRIQVGSDWDVSLEVRVDGAQGYGTLYNEPDMVPATNAPPPWHGEGESFVFVGPGVYFRGYSAETDARAFEALPQQTKAHVVTAMTRDRVSTLSFGNTIRAGFADEIHQMLDPEGQLSRVAQLCAWLSPHASVFATNGDGDGESESEDEPGRFASEALTCKYCRTLFLLAAHYRCPNCGALPSA